MSDISPDGNFLQRLKTLLIGGARSPQDREVFHKLTLAAFFAWVGLGSDGMSSSCYGPEEAFLALGEHKFLAIFVALASAITIFVISASYSQIIELFPSGGGGYVVASKLVSPTVGMVAGCALLIDYVLTISISIAAGSDALFSFLPMEWSGYKLGFIVASLVAMILLNLRGVKESVAPLVPIFLAFLLTHAIAILYGILTHLLDFPVLANKTVKDLSSTHAELGLWGMLVLMLRAYSMGAGTFTGIEAVSNGLTILREPRVQTAKKTMRYMAISLALTATGLMLGYLLYELESEPGKTLNAVLMEKITRTWNPSVAWVFVFVTLLSEATLLVIAAQTGFLDGPRVLANMAVDRWFPTKFATLSDRLVTQNGIMLMGGAALVTIWFSGGSVRLLVVLYSINVFITFVLSQLGMVRHWLQVRKTEPNWIPKLLINGSSFLLTALILVAVVVLKFHEGGWVTILITATLIVVALLIHRHYRQTLRLLGRLDDLMATAVAKADEAPVSIPPFNPDGKTAVILVNGFNGLGLHTLLNVVRLFGKHFQNFVFVQVGVVDAGNFKGAAEIEHLQRKLESDLERYVRFVGKQGYFGKGICSIGTEVIDEISALAPKIVAEFPGAVFFAGQLVFARESFVTRWLHNYVVFAIQRQLYPQGIPFVILPIRV
ncbi:MAG TPA: APC family permease [Phycisphaerae bacterium]|nr:APC family permease [Phycisphaerae bacterium]